MRSAAAARAARALTALLCPLLAAACAATQPSIAFLQTRELCHEEASARCAPLRRDFFGSAHCQHQLRLRCLRQLGWVHTGGGAWLRTGHDAVLEREIEAALN